MFGSIALLLVLIFVAWVGTREEPTKVFTSATPIAAGISVVVPVPPANTRAGVPVSMTWSVRAPVGAVATSSAISWGSTPNPTQLGTDASPAAAGYPNLLPEYARGSFALPREFTAPVVFDQPGTHVYRAYAEIDGRHYWSSEYSITVE